MKVWIKDGKPVFFPIAGAVLAGDAVENVDAHDATTHEPGPVAGVTIENGVVKINRKAKAKDQRKLAREQLEVSVTNANTLPALKAAVAKLVELL